MSDAATIERFRSGDPDAVADVYRSYGPTVFSVALRALGDRSLAEEATQQTFVKAWRAAHTIRPGSDPGPWLYTIARRTAIDLYRRERRRSADSYDEPSSSAASSAEAALVTHLPSLERAWDGWQVREAVESLGDDEREIVRLAHFDGLSHQEIADCLGIPVGTVKSRSYRAHRRLAERLGHVVEEQR